MRTQLETMQIFLCSLSVCSSLTYFYMIGVHGFLVFYSECYFLFDAQIVSDRCIEFGTSESLFKLVSVSFCLFIIFEYAHACVPSEVLDLLNSFPVPFLESAFVSF